MMQSSNNIEMTDQASVADTVNSDISGVPLDSVEAGSSLPHPQEVRTSMSSARGKTGVRIYVYIAIGTIVLLSLIIGLAVGIPKSNKSASSTSLSFVPRKATRAQLVEYFVVHGVSPRFALEQSTSPQGMAVEWLAGRDGQNLAVPEGDLSSSEGYALLERYVLAILYYSTNGPQWRSRTGFLSDNDVCTWAGLRYNGRNFFDFGVVCLGQTSERTMRALYLDNNLLRGSIPSELGTLTDLQILDLNFNAALVGSIPADLCQLTNLGVLAFAYGDLTGAIPDCIDELRELYLLVLSNNLLSGKVPPGLSTLSEMRALYIDDNALSGDISTMFNNMPNLTLLYTEDNALTGTLDDSFMQGHQNIRAIDLSTNDIGGIVPEHLFGFPKLEVLDLHKNKLIGRLPHMLPNSTSLVVVALHQNNITGDIPASFTNLEVLEHLDLAESLYTGDIPTELGMIESLEYLFLASNEGLTPGPIPEEFASLTALEELSLKSTNRTGPLPDFLSTMSNLTLLDLDDNSFNGALPQSYGDLKKLEFLLLNRNPEISGPIPMEYAGLTSLRVLFLDGTGITGNMEQVCSIPSLTEPDEDLDGDELVFADCGGPNPPISNCSCCDTCCVSGEDCHDNTLIASLDPIWERRFRRFAVEFGDESRFIDRDFLTPGA